MVFLACYGRNRKLGKAERNKKTTGKVLGVRSRLVFVSPDCERSKTTMYNMLYLHIGMMWEIFHRDDFVVVYSSSRVVK